MIKKCYPDGRHKAVTFSFDDGFPQDVRLISILNRYGLYATFNIMSGCCHNSLFAVSENGENRWDGSSSMRECYKGHEIASHTKDHFHPFELSDADLDAQIIDDIKALSRLFGYSVRGFASPYGQFDDRLIGMLKKYGIRYHRSVNSTSYFSLPEDFMVWNPSAHFAYFEYPEGQKLLDVFLGTETELACLYIWGHSYEMSHIESFHREAQYETSDRWEHFENMLCRRIAGKDDVWYATNIEICDYISAMRRAVISEEKIENPTDTQLFFDVDGRTLCVLPHSTVKI